MEAILSSFKWSEKSGAGHSRLPIRGGGLGHRTDCGVSIPVIKLHIDEIRIPADWHMMRFPKFTAVDRLHLMIEVYNTAERPMIIAHAPSGYILATSLMRRIASASVSARAVVAAGIIGALAPDFDMAYFHLIDNRQTHHHKYLSHWPIIWLMLAAASALWFGCARQSKVAALSLVFCLGGVLHVVLDTFVGDIWWLAPFIDQPYAIFTVPARFKPWWLSFVLHWSFAVELAVCIWALVVFRGRSKP